MLVSVRENAPTVQVTAQNVTLTEGQTEIDLTGAVTVTGEGISYTLTMTCDGATLAGNKLTVANEDRTYTVTVRVTGDGFTAITRELSVSVTAYRAEKESGKGCGGNLGASSLLGLLLLGCAAGLVLGKRRA